MFSEMSLVGKTAIVTGSGRGIGRAIALVMAEAGANVVTVARTAIEIEKTAADVRSLGRKSMAITADVTDSSDVDSMVDRTLDRFGNVDILINNAGKLLRVPMSPFPDMELKPPQVTRETSSRMRDDEWQSIIDANLSGVFFCCRAVAPHMMKKRYGKVINIGSNNAIQAFPMVAAYNASKAAVNMMTRVLALEWAPYNICVNAIGPGSYHTPMTDMSWTDPEERKKKLDAIPLGREGDTRDIGILATYLASPASDYMTGQVIYIDGGQTAK